MSRSSFAILAYRALTALAQPLAPLWLRRRVARGKEEPDRLGERLGRASQPRPNGRLLWLHGASVGESLSLLSVIEHARQRRPDAGVLVTAGTRTAQALLARRLPKSVIAQYAPLDTPAAVAGFLDHWRPDLGVLVESELWPNLILGAKTRGVSLALVSARMSPASVQRWRLAPRAARTVLGAFELILARDDQEAARLKDLGGVVTGVMDLKFGAPPLPACETLRSRFDALGKGRPILLAASTHPGEELLIAQAFVEARKERSDAVLVIVPRHPERGPDVTESVAALGLPVGLRSRGEADAPIVIADALGELGTWYRLANLAVIGGSLIPGVGGHNPMEPARLDCPFVAGPHHADWPVYEALAAARATRIVEPSDLAGVLALAWRDPEELARMSERARAFCAQRDGAVREGIERVLALLPR